MTSVGQAESFEPSAPFAALPGGTSPWRWPGGAPWVFVGVRQGSMPCSIRQVG